MGLKNYYIFAKIGGGEGVCQAAPRSPPTDYSVQKNSDKLPNPR